MPDIDLEPWEYRLHDDAKVARRVLVFWIAFALFALWSAGLFFDHRGWAIAFFSMMAGFALAFAFPRYWWQQR